MIYCKTQANPFACSMEFLHDNSTVESIRYSDGECFDKFGKCKPGICSCSEDCASFHWNLTTTAVKTNDSFCCKMRIYNFITNTIVKVCALADYSGKGTVSLQLTRSCLTNMTLC